MRKSTCILDVEKEEQYCELGELEQYTRMTGVIIAGLQVSRRSYARAVSADSEGELAELDAGCMEQQVAAGQRH